MYDTNAIETIKEWYMLSYAYKSAEGKITVKALPDFQGYKPGSEDDGALVRSLHLVLDEADIVIAHNIRFDIRKSNARFLVHRLPPPSYYKTICTLQLARKHFAFNSNRLDSLGQVLGFGRKLPHQGKHTWLGCMNGNRKSWALLKKYNAHDVELLQSCYERLRAWSTTHPNLNHYTGHAGCPVCQSRKLKLNGSRYLKTGRRQQFKCTSCGHQFTDGPLIKVPT